jgi:hypothetical protein
VQRKLGLPVITQAAGRDEVGNAHHALEQPLQRASLPPSGLAQPFVPPGQSHQQPEHHISDPLSGGDLPAAFSTSISSGAPELRGAIVAPATAIVTSVPGNSGTGLRTPMFSGGSSPEHPGELSPRYSFQPVETTPVLRRSAEAPSTMEAGATPRSSKPDAPMAPLVLAQRAQGVGEAPEFRAPGTVALSRVGETTIIQRQAGAPDTPPPQDPPSVMDAPPATPADPGSQMDVGRLANQVYDLLVQRLARERERRGL